MATRMMKMIRPITRLSPGDEFSERLDHPAARHVFRPLRRGTESSRVEATLSTSRASVVPSRIAGKTLNSSGLLT